MNAHRGGQGPPLVLVHGLTATWKVWEPVIPALEQHFTVYAPTLSGHLGGTPWTDGTPVSIPALADSLEALLDAEGLERAHLVGNSLGGWLSLELGRRGRALSITAFSPAGGFDRPKDLRRVVRLFRVARWSMQRLRPVLEELSRRPRSRKLVLGAVMEHGERVPPKVAIEQLDEALGCLILPEFLDWVSGEAGLSPATEPLDVPVRIVWGEQDKTIPFAQYGRPIVAAVPGAGLQMLAGAGHVPMHDDPGGVVRNVLEVTAKATTGGNDMPATEFAGARGRIHLHRWENDAATFAVVLAHGYGEHAARFDHVARALVAAGAVVVAPDHQGHGLSEGTRALVDDYEPVVDDLSTAADMVQAEHPGLPLVLVGHSLGGLIGTRLAQRDPSRFAAIVLSAPFVGGNPDVEGMMGLDPLPEVPIDPAVLSRDPAVGEAYLADELVYHGPFQRPFLEATFATVKEVAAGPTFGTTPTIWVHGDEDGLAPLAVTQPVVERLAEVLEPHVYPGARHEVFNETNKDEVIGDVVAFLQRALA